MDIGARIRQVRNALGLNQTEFGDKIGLKQSSLGQIESGVRNTTDRIIYLICEKYNVNEKWLRTGNGEMIIQLSRDEEIAGFMGDVLNKESGEFKKRFISMLSRLTESEWELLECKAKELFEEQDSSSDKEQ